MDGGGERWKWVPVVGATSLAARIYLTGVAPVGIIDGIPRSSESVTSASRSSPPLRTRGTSAMEEHSPFSEHVLLVSQAGLAGRQRARGVSRRGVGLTASAGGIGYG